MRTLKLIGYFILFLLINQSCLDEVDISTIPQDEITNEVRDNALHGTINGEYFATDSILFTLLEGQLLFHFVGKTTFLPDFIPISNLTGVEDRFEDDFQMKIVNFTGIGEYQLYNVSNENDTSSLFQLEQFYTTEKWRSYVNNFLYIKEASDYFTLEIHNIDIEQGKISGNIYAQLHAKSDSSNQQNKEFKILMSFNAPLDLPIESNLYPFSPQEDCTMNGQYLGVDFCTSNFRGLLKKDGPLLLNVYPKDLFLPLPDEGPIGLACEWDMISIWLRENTGPGYYVLSYKSENHQFGYVQCVYSFHHYYNPLWETYLTDYSILYLEQLDLEKRRVSGYIASSLSRKRVDRYPHRFIKLKAYFDAPLEIE